MDGNKLTWVEEITATSAANFNRLEALVQDAVQDSKQAGLLNTRPAASAATKNWIWTDSASGRDFYCDGTQWIEMSPATSFAAVDYHVNTNVNVGTPPASITAANGTVLGSGQTGGGSFTGRLALTGQTAPAENGLYDYAYNSFNGSRTLTRCTDANRSEHFRRGMTVQVVRGPAGRTLTYTGASNPTIGTDALTFTTPVAAATWTYFVKAADTGNQFFTVPFDATVLVHYSGTGYSGGGGLCFLDCWFDGVYVNSLNFYFNQTNVHMDMGVFPYTTTVAAGQHSVRMFPGTGVSRDANDINGISVLMLPR